MPPFDLERVQNAVRQEKLDGWLFSGFRHRDPLSEDILSLPSGLTNSRRWFYAVPAYGDPVKIVPYIESNHLDTLPGKLVYYLNLRDYIDALRPLAGKRWGVHISEEIPIISLMDAGTAFILEKTGLTLVSAGGLIQRFKSLLSDGDIASHERAASGLYDIIDEVWNAARSAYHQKSPLYEGDLRKLMLLSMKKRGLVTDHPPIVGSGIHSADPHYDLDGKGSLIQEGDLIQFDVWAKESAPGSVYADISWIGFFGSNVPNNIQAVFNLPPPGMKHSRLFNRNLTREEGPQGRRLISIAGKSSSTLDTNRQ